jgi:acetyl-CoA carboxylase carboxyltransferase component
MSDEAVIVRNQEPSFLEVLLSCKAATGEEVTAKNGRRRRSLQDFRRCRPLAQNDADAMRIVREIFRSIPAAKRRPLQVSEPKSHYDPKTIYDIVPNDRKIVRRSGNHLRIVGR